MEINHLKDTGIGLNNLEKQLNENLLEAEKKISSTRLKMEALISEYKNVFREPVVHMAKHKMSGVIAIRWRERGTQRFVDLDEPHILTQLNIDQQRKKRHIKIGDFEARRLLLNYEYSIWFHARKRLRGALEGIARLKAAALL